MEALKNTLAVLAGVVGVLTSILTMYAKYLDVKKSNAGDVKAAEDALAMAAVPLKPAASFHSMEEPGDLIGSDFPARYGSMDVAQAQQLVKAPAIALIVAGVLTFFVNLGTPVIYLVGQNLAQAAPESRNRQASFEMSRSESPSNDPATIEGMLMVFCLSVPSAVAVWAGFGMLRLRSYWVSVAGSCAIMLGGVKFCCIGGIPVGVWSLVILFRPDVSSYFR